MKLRAQIEGLAVPATIAAVLARDVIVAITGNRTVNKAGADALAVGRLSIPAKAANVSGTVETRFKALIEVKADGAIAAGDKPETMFGVCWNGAADGGVVEVLTY